MSTTTSDRRASVTLHAPQAADFAPFPASWYRLCASRQIDRGPFRRQVYDRKFVAFRQADGKPVVMDATCRHLGADLGLGKVNGDCIACPFHGWTYGPDGHCRVVPGCDQPPDFAVQPVFPCTERDGAIYFFNGREPAFPLPFFLGESPAAFRSIAPREFTAPCTWFMVNAHAFDVQHFLAVHGRRLLEPLQVDSPDRWARRSSYLAEVLGDKFYDRFLRRVVSSRVRITLTIWGGTFAVVTGDFGERQSRFFVISEPTLGGHTRCDVVVFTPRLENRWLAPWIEPLMLRIRRLLTTAYLREESHGLGSPCYNPTSLTEIDREMVEYFHWAASLI